MPNPSELERRQQEAGRLSDLMRQVDLMRADAYRFHMVRALLKELGCPITDGCYLPTTIENWVKGVWEEGRRHAAPPEDAPAAGAEAAPRA